MTNEQQILQLICSCCFEINSTINDKLKFNHNFFEYKTEVHKVFEEEYFNLPQWLELEQKLLLDPILNKGWLALGGYGTPREICKKVFFDSLQSDKRLICSRSFLAFNSYIEVVRCLEKREVIYTGCVRLFGIDLGSDLKISEDFGLVNLSDHEITDREQILYTFSSYFDNPDVHRTELEVRIHIQINLEEDGSLPKSMFEALDITKELATDFVSSLYLYRTCEVLIGTIVVLGGFVNRITQIRDLTRNMLEKTVKLESSDIIPLYTIFNMVKAARQNDDIFKRALSRFVMARERSSDEDRIVDFVISLESILLTEKKSAMMNELSYRFSLNGSSLIHNILPNVDRKEIFRRMKGIYNIRSKIVHGESLEKIRKSISNIEFSDLASLNNYLDECIRHIIIWLAGVSTEDRPYNKEGAWEDLLWSKGL